MGYGATGKSKSIVSVMYHVIFGHSSARRVRSILKPLDIDVHADGWCNCEICTSCKTQAPSRRKFENRNVPTHQSSGDYFKSTVPEEQQAIHQMKTSEEAAAKNDANVNKGLEPERDMFTKVSPGAMHPATTGIATPFHWDPNVGEV